ncbi:30S ribosomal protein S3 [bacterium (Candidatus Gribaldobacteria) CG_4_9_14_3_um_filter_36_15]|uniref:Small ribosomal subunit protein uS3 n=3 Tax=Candidatus Gribaldobacteria TaxID=2798536 RepID=A0A2H0UWX4_9BACT|nr:MAG: 30S ribosomal protein S3 [Parcubacteria group bacterium CG2_30_36_21]PIR91307.1 MAG: 30S ribosomal protein S3 [bacterium (Candidatus Gribaldobacteria) CG10_big_fil_rev_8_21_14_0_10_37_46]PIV14099.1 MAG: 30S ribosomal protein S3 [bacterium (Candidatus Gribaldobacteria) CG03_land_8_20_14_0_80_36_40]PJB09213.1 MAG: 30S ribosomal protein S3 [bacterium (Candidatus Gribaldobacteria) CG_4_9_14_3_um_filter_36_15]
MSHKVHPKVYRIKEMKDWFSRGFYGKNFPRYLEEDFKIREFLMEKLKEASIENVEIERSLSAVKIIIKTSRPALVIGRGGEVVEKLKKDLVKKLQIKEGKREMKIEIQEVKSPWFSANICAQWIAQQIKRRVQFRRVMKMALSKIMSQKGVKGARVEVAGRLNGVEIARTEWLKEGQLPRQNLRADIDYGTSLAFCTYGVIGVKVWIYKGERFAK